MEILFFDEIDSTHKFLLTKIKSKEITDAVCVVADHQTGGVGSRGNEWISQKGNLFLSLCVDLKQLPKDLPLQSTSIYFAYIFKEILSSEGSKIWVKWPNDFYIKDKKIGGVITVKTSQFIVCSIGLNILHSPENFDKIDMEIDRDEFVRKFIKKIRKNISWKQVFSKYKIEFQKSRKFNFHYNGDEFSLEKAELDFDGSVLVDGRKIYNLR